MLPEFASKTRIIGTGLIVLFIVLSMGATRRKAPVFDETLHLFAGYAYLKWGDFGINPEHPPLAKMLAALPLVALNLNHQGVERQERDYAQANRGHAWELANRFLFLNNDAERIFLPAKCVMVFLAVILGLFIFAWTRELFGPAAAMVALFIYCLDPNILAHAPLVHTDIPFALCFFAASYFFWRSLYDLSWLNLLLTALFYALAAITKFSFVTILPLWLLLGLIRIFSKAPQRSRITDPSSVNTLWGKTTLLIVLIGSVLLAGYLVIWLTYGLRFDTAPYARAELSAVSAAAKTPGLESIARMASEYLFLPNSWIFGITDAFRSLDRPAYLLGEIKTDGFWLYFPIVFLAKTPMPTLLLLLAGILSLLFLRHRLRGAAFLLLPVSIFFLAAVWSHINIGLRHILPIYPFLFVWLGGVAMELWKWENRYAKLSLAALAIWLIGSTVKTYPDYLAFFNEAAGGPNNGHNILVDSNLDWGQDLKGLKVWMERNKVEKIQLAYFGMANPRYYKIAADLLPGTLFSQWDDPQVAARQPSHAAISATYLMGYNLADRNAYARFRQQQPVAVIGHSIWVYELPH